MGFSFPFLRANALRTYLLIMRTHILSYVGLFLNLISNAVKNNDQHVRPGTNVRLPDAHELARSEERRVHQVILCT